MSVLGFAEKFFPVPGSLFLLLSFGLCSATAQREQEATGSQTAALRSYTWPCDTAALAHFRLLLQGVLPCWLTSCLQGTIPVHPLGAPVMRYALFKMEVQGEKKKQRKQLYCKPLLMAYKVEPETFGLGFVLLIFFIWLFSYLLAFGVFLLLLFFFQLDIQVLSILLLWKI